jgi:hypothetical protein
MMKELLCILVLMLAGAAAQARPGVGIVKDSRGNLFYTDTKQVWKKEAGRLPAAGSTVTAPFGCWNIPLLTPSASVESPVTEANAFSDVCE